MPKGQIVINNALTALGLLEQGGTPSVSDTNDALGELNTAWDAWSIDESLIYAQQPYQGVLSAGRGIYTIGTTGDFATPRPARIYQAYISNATVFTGSVSLSSTLITTSQAGLSIGQSISGPGIPNNTYITGVISGFAIAISQPATATGIVSLRATGGNRTELEIIEADRYYRHNDLGASAQTPDELYPDYLPNSANLSTLYLWPVPSVSNTLEIDCGVTFATWDLTTNYYIPQGMQDAIQYALAWRLLPRFGAAVAQQVAESVRELGLKAEQRFMGAVAFNRQKPMEAAGGPASSPITPAAAAQYKGLQPQG